ncbi:MAG: autotransporter-associated beta strand repeat-containing protein [Sphingomonas sp.]|uniref:autotransporter-associated beta strand repeat-containing protein n=1 Tax=Sphingomonas sp. TaxID=28214 RepID=UPI00183A50CD|nr:autotransporter-associated beta strand repeat-containing protein [Sphingomonas sp.]
MLGSASFLSLTFATGAQAQSCTVSSGDPLNNITTDGSTVSCTGIVNGPTINATADGTVVDVIAPGTIVTGASINANGNGNVLFVRNNAVFNGSVVNFTGAANTLVWSAISNNLFVTLTGANSQVILDNGSQVTLDPGQFTVSSGAGESNTILLNTGGGVFATGGNGQYLLNGGTGNQNVAILGAFQAPSDGLAIALGDGDDSIAIGGSANITTQGGGAAQFDGGAGDDTFSLNFNGTWQHSTVGFETINLNPNTVLTLTGTNIDATQINVQGGSVTVTSGAALGVANSTVDIAQFGTLTLGYTASASFDNTLTGSGGLNVDASGHTITFGGDGSGYTGAVTVGAGTTAAVGIANALGSGTIANNGTLSFGGFDLANDISGTGQVIVTGTGNSFLGGTNTFSGGMDIQGGVLDVTSVNALGTGTITTSTVMRGILGVGNAADEVLANDLTGNLLLVKAGAGVLDLTGTNTYTGGTLISQGSLRVDGFARLGTGQVFSSAGTSLILDYNGAAQLLQTTTFLDGAGSFIKEGTGNVVMNVTSTYTGGTIIRAGRIGLNNGDALGTGAIQIDAGAELGVGNIFLNNNLTGSGLVRKTASNAVELYGDNSGFTGTIRVEDGILVANNGNALGSGILQLDSGTGVQLTAANNSIVAADLAGSGFFEKFGAGLVALTGDGSQFSGGIAISGGTLQIEGSQNIGNSSIVFIDSGATLLLDTAGNTNLFNAVSGDGNLVKTGTGTVFLTGNNTYTGGTEIQQGAIRVTDTAFLGTGAITVQAGAALDLSIAGAQTLNQNVTGAGLLRKSGGGDLTLLGNGLTGGVDITNGRVIVNTASALGGGPVTTAVDTQLVFDNAATEVSNTLISGAGALTKDGAGLLVINNANSFTGGTVINTGRLGLNDGMGLGTGDVIVLQNAILGVGGVALANNVSGAGQIIKTANNTAVLTGNNTYSGGTDIQQGRLVVNAPAALGTGGVQMAANTALVVDYNGATNVALNNVLTGAGALVKEGSGTVVMNTMGNTFSGGTFINAGRLGLNFGDALGTGDVTVASGAELGIGGISLANKVSGAGRIVKTSAGTAFLTGTNTHSGGLDIQGGSVDVTGNTALGTGVVTIASGASLNYFNSAAATFGNGLSGAGTFNKLGAGQLTFANNFTLGALNAAAGRTRINVIATTNATVASGATLDGTGRIVGNLVNNGTVAPGNSIGTLTVQGNYTQNAGSVLEIEFDAGGNIDLLDVTGNAVLNGGTIRFVGIGGAEGQGGTFLRTGGTVTGTFATVETVGAQLPLSVIYTANTGQMAPSVLTARPSTFNAQSLAAADTALGFIEVIGLADARHGRGNRLWLSGFGAWADRSASGQTLAYDHETRGISGGVNFAVGGNITLGAAVGWADGEITLGSNGGGGDQTHTLASLTARWQGPSGLSLGAGALYGEVDQTTLRNVSFNGFSGSVDGATNSTIYGGFAKVGIPLGAYVGWNFEAGLRGSVIRQEQDGYTESGTSPLRLTLDDLGTTTVEGQARLIGTTRLWDASNGAEENASGLDLRVDLGLRYLGLVGDREIPVTFAVSNAGIVLQGDTRDTLQGAGGIALDYTTNGGARLSLGYRGEFAQTDRHTVQAGVSIAF